MTAFQYAAGPTQAFQSGASLGLSLQDAISARDQRKQNSALEEQALELRQQMAIQAMAEDKAVTEVMRQRLRAALMPRGGLPYNVGANPGVGQMGPVAPGSIAFTPPGPDDQFHQMLDQASTTSEMKALEPWLKDEGKKSQFYTTLSRYKETGFLDHLPPGSPERVRFDLAARSEDRNVLDEAVGSIFLHQATQKAQIEMAQQKLQQEQQQVMAAAQALYNTWQRNPRTRSKTPQEAYETVLLRKENIVNELTSAGEGTGTTPASRSQIDSDIRYLEGQMPQKLSSTGQSVPDVTKASPEIRSRYEELVKQRGEMVGLNEKPKTLAEAIAVLRKENPSITRDEAARLMREKGWDTLPRQ